MNTIHKFLIDAWNETVLELPAGFKVRMVARTITENKKTTLYGEVQPQVRP